MRMAGQGRFVLLLMIVLSLCAGLIQPFEASSSSEEVVTHRPASSGRWVAATDPVRVDIVCRARCIAKCISDNTTAAAENNPDCERMCSYYNDTWLHEICTTAECQETCANLTGKTESQLFKPSLHEVSIINDKVVLSWEFASNCSACQSSSVVHVLRYSSSWSNWSYQISTDQDQAFYLDAHRVCADFFQVMSVNQFGVSPVSDIKTLRPLKIIQDDTLNVTSVKQSAAHPYLTVVMSWQYISGWVPEIDFVLDTRVITCEEYLESRKPIVANQSFIVPKDLARGGCFVSLQLSGNFSVCHKIQPVNLNYTYDCHEILGDQNCQNPKTPVVNMETVNITPYTNNRTARVDWPQAKSNSLNTVYGYWIQWGQLVLPKGKKIRPFHDNTTVILENIGQENTSVYLEGLSPGIVYGVKIKINLGVDEPDFKMMNIKDFSLPADDVTSVKYDTLTQTEATLPKVPSSNLLLRVGVPVMCLAALLILVLSVVCLRQKRRSRVTKGSLRRDEESMPNVYCITPAGDSIEPPIPDRWEVMFDQIEMGDILGKGQFGTVRKAMIMGKVLAHNASSGSNIFRESLKRNKVEVAVKMLHGYADVVQRQEFHREMKLMKDISCHSNLVSLLGCCSIDATPMCLIVEHCCHGDLLHYLRANREIVLQSRKDSQYEGCDANDSLTPNDLLSFARQIARGMEFLAQKGFVHRDLAARNVMVAEDKTVKIGDFGLTRYVFDDQIYVHRRGGKLPIKWMSVEALFDQVFTICNDVWSFGVLLFELVSLGASPYPGIQNKDIPGMLKRGDRMQKPENCSDILYAIMIACWHPCPEERPTFTHLRNQLEELLEENTPYMDFNQDYSHFPFFEITEELDSDTEEEEEEEEEEVEEESVGARGRVMESLTRSDEIPMVSMEDSDEYDKPTSTHSSDDVFEEAESSQISLIGGNENGNGKQSRETADSGNLQKRDSGLGSDSLYSSRHTNMEDVPLM